MRSSVRATESEPHCFQPVASPVSASSLFQIHAEKVLALRRRFGVDIPLLLMTSPATHDETVAFFESHDRFGLPKASVIFFQQGTMPALDFETGKLLLEEPGRLFLGPNGHGGTLTGLAEHGLLDDLQRRGIRTIYYFQVDNPLVHLADFVFIGRHLAEKAEVSSKVVAMPGRIITTCATRRERAFVAAPAARCRVSFGACRQTDRPRDHGRAPMMAA